MNERTLKGRSFGLAVVMLATVSLLIVPHHASSAQDSVTSAPGTVAAATTAPDLSVPGSLGWMLDRVPNLSLPIDQSIVVTYSDVAGQFSAAGLDGSSVAKSLALVAGALPLPRHAVYWNEDDWRSTVGFGLLDVDQVAETGSNSDTIVTVMQGRFDPAGITQTWEHTGYQPRKAGERTIYEYAFDIDFTKPYSLELTEPLKYAAFLEDGILVFSNTSDGITATIAVEDKPEQSIARRADVAPLLASARSDLATAHLVNGSFFAIDFAAQVASDPNVAPELRESLTQDLEQAFAQFAPMPPIETALIGTSRGGPIGRCADGTCPGLSSNMPQAVLEISLSFNNRDEAEQASKAVADRLPNMTTLTSRTPYTDYVRLSASHVAEGLSVCIVELIPSRFEVGQYFLASRDFLFLAYPKE